MSLLAEAREQVRARAFEHAKQTLTLALTEAPGDLDALRLDAECDERMGAFRTAYATLLTVTEHVTPDARTCFKLGTLAMRVDHQQSSQAALAQRWFERSLALDPTLAQAHFHLGIVHCVQGRHVESEPHFRRAAELDPNMAKAHHELAKALFQADRLDEASEQLARVLEIDPQHGAAKADLADLNRVRAVARDRPRIVRFPHRIAQVSDVRRAILEHVACEDYPAALAANSRVTTFGSCFAGNVARALREAGIAAKNTTFGEFINSTFANRQYLEWVVNGTDNAVTRAIAEFHAGDPNFSGDPLEHRATIAESDIIIMTVGVAPCFFDRETGELVVPKSSSISTRALLGRCEFRTTSVAENVANLEQIVALLRKLAPAATLVLTLSPVPLTATFEYPSAVVADCVSKSVLRVAVDELLRKRPENLYYWPSFEVIRWLGAYTGPMYGAEDNSTLHVSEAVIATQVDTFMEVFSRGRVAREQAAPTA
ncbi:MAG TPA: GSCFA domain-containing protein [Polyangiaceae bacterium]|nr:GSCFA domain-containing protein [Polyangiaceae bacterium]